MVTLAFLLKMVSWFFAIFLLIWQLRAFSSCKSQLPKLEEWEEWLKEYKGIPTREIAISYFTEKLQYITDYIFLQRAGIVAPLVGVLLTASSFMSFQPQELEIASKIVGQGQTTQLIMAIQPLFLGVSIGAFLAIINQIFLLSIHKEIQKRKSEANKRLENKTLATLPQDKSLQEFVNQVENITSTIENMNAKFNAINTSMTQVVTNFQTHSTNLQNTFQTITTPIEKCLANFAVKFEENTEKIFARIETTIQEIESKSQPIIQSGTVIQTSLTNIENAGKSLTESTNTLATSANSLNGHLIKTNTDLTGLLENVSKYMEEMGKKISLATDTLQTISQNDVFSSSNKMFNELKQVTKDANEITQQYKSIQSILQHISKNDVFGSSDSLTNRFKETSQDVSKVVTQYSTAMTTWSEIDQTLKNILSHLNGNGKSMQYGVRSSVYPRNAPSKFPSSRVSLSWWEKINKWWQKLW